MADRLTSASELKAKRLGLLSQDEALVFMRADCAVCRSEGLLARSHAPLSAGGNEVIATLYQTNDSWLGMNEAMLKTRD